MCSANLNSMPIALLSRVCDWFIFHESNLRLRELGYFRSSQNYFQVIFNSDFRPNSETAFLKIRP